MLHPDRIRPALAPASTSAAACPRRTARSRHPLRAASRTGTLLVAAVWTSVSGCRSAVASFGATPPEARVNADRFFASLANRFVNVHRAPKFEVARMKLSRHALSPSRIFGDTAVWTSVAADGARRLTLEGVFAQGRYGFFPRLSAPLPDAPADSRHVIDLRRIDDDEYRWTTDVLHAMGPVPPADVSDAFAALLAAAEGRPETALRSDYRTSFPRATRALFQLFRLDTLRSIPAADGSSAVTLGVRLHPDRLRTTYPNFARYVEKYVSPARYRFTLRDRRGATYFDAEGDDEFVRVRLRTRGGRLVPLTGAPTAMPDSLELRIDASTRFKIFTVGVTKLVGDFVLSRDAGERAWTMRFRREPDWHFPLAVRQLIRSPLRRPFEGDGILFRLALRSAPGATTTLLDRDLDFVVRESAIVRWLGGLGSGAMSDFAGKAEVEENRFIAEVLNALRADIDAVLAPGS